MTADDTLSVASKVYKHLNMTACNRNQALAALVIVNQLLLMDEVNDPKSTEPTN